jgi:hypothetical protein
MWQNKRDGRGGDAQMALGGKCANAKVGIGSFSQSGASCLIVYENGWFEGMRGEDEDVDVDNLDVFVWWRGTVEAHK